MWVLKTAASSDCETKEGGNDDDDNWGVLVSPKNVGKGRDIFFLPRHLFNLVNLVLTFVH